MAPSQVSSTSRFTSHEMPCRIHPSSPFYLIFLFLFLLLPSSTSSSSGFNFRTDDDQVCRKVRSNSNEEDDDDEEEQHQDKIVAGHRVDGITSSAMPERWHVCLGLEKGTRMIVNHESGRVWRAMDGCSYEAAAGGSLCNSLVSLARLGAHLIGDTPLNVAMVGSVGSDPFSGFYRKHCSLSLYLLEN